MFDDSRLPTTEETKALAHPDRRVRRTREALRQAQIELVLERPYDSITVQQILDRANVGRSTFYMHFSDKDDLLLSGLDELREMLAVAQEEGRVAARGPERIIGFSRSMFEHADEFRHVFHALSRSRVWPVVGQRLEEVLAELVRRECAAEMRALRRSTPEMPVDLFVHWITSTFMAVMTWWIEGASEASPEEIDRLFRALVLPAARSILA